MIKIKRKRIIKETELLQDNSLSIIVEESRRALQKGGFPKADCIDFTFLTAEILDEYAEHFGAGAKVEYLVLKRFGKIELKIYYTGDKFNPFEDSDDAEELAADKTLRHLLLDKTSTITHSYVLGKNVITINSSARDKEKLEIRSPMLWAAILGMVAGIICQRLPDGIILVLVILTLELSIASPGVTSAWTILFASLSLPLDYVGVFTVYKMLTTNFVSAGGMLYSTLEQIEIADIVGVLDKKVYES